MTSIPASVEDAIMRAIQKDPAQRFQTAGDFREFLLDAGYFDEGSLRRTTGSKRAISGSRPAPPVSDPEIPAITAESSPVIKETRLGAPSGRPAYVADVKETRLGNIGAIHEPAPSVVKHGPTFFERLTWVHYAGAGSVLVVLLIFFLIVPIVLFSGVFSKSPEGEAGPANLPPANKQSAAVAPSPTPTLARTPEPIRAPIAAPTMEPDPEMTPAETPAPVEREPAPPVKKKAPVTKKTPVTKKGGSLKDARCALTGDC